MSLCPMSFAVFELPVFEFEVTPRIKINKEQNLTLVGYIDMFGHYFDLSMFTLKMRYVTREKYDRYKMSKMQKPSGNGNTVEEVSYMFQ